VIARADDPTLAARLANRFTQAALQVRSNQLRLQVTRAIANTRAQLASAPSAGPLAAALAASLTDLQAMATGKDPTITLAQPAIPPSSATGPGGLLLIVLGVLAGCAVAIGTALLLEIRNPSIRDEEEALTLYPLPVLARVPQLPLAPRRKLPSFVEGPLRAKRSPVPLSMAATEAYRALRIQLELTTLGPRALMITSPSRNDGKSSTAVGLALELAASGVSVILVDGDLRSPHLRQVLRLGEADLSDGRAVPANVDSLEGLLEAVPAVERLRLLELQRVAAADDAVKFVTTRIGEVIQRALEMADYVIVDTAPLGEVSDPLSLIRAVDEVLVVVRLRNSRRTSLEVMRDRLERSNAGLVGYVIVGSEELPPYAYRDEPSVGMQSQ
jgi:Mrp family chromosome partitioning ATPase/predicted outer membrane lipoprotein